MKWIMNSIVSLVLVACFLPDATRAATKEQLATIFFRLYNGMTNETYIDFHLEEAEAMLLDMDLNRPTVIYIHGYTENLNRTSVNTVVNAYLDRNDHNVIALDWSVIAGENYVQVVSNVESVGAAVALAIDDMVQAGLSAEKLHLVGHSMGAQVSAYIGRKVHNKIPRITGLDPAGPFFNLAEQRLADTDAGFVDIIHTDRGFYGNIRISGTVDFFPNAGRRVQPGCPLFYSFNSQGDYCSHSYSWRYYAESLKYEKSFLAVPCSNNNQSPGRKQNPGKAGSDMIVMGYATPTDAKGSYCLVTGPSEPHGLGVEGAREA